jgi:hypothetical protein
MGLVPVTEFARPDLRIPLAPVPGPAGVARRYLLGLRDAGFGRARRIAVVWAAIGCVLAVVAALLPSPWRWAVVACAALAGLYGVSRALALVAAERQQYDFERDWVAGQTEMLRVHSFDVLRFTIEDVAEGDQGTRRTYDLTSAASVRALTGMQEQDRVRAQPAFVATVEFAYLGDDGVLSVGSVHRDLRELVFRPGGAASGQAWIRFPEARYLPRPSASGHPARLTYWVLSGPVLLVVTDAAYAVYAEGAARPAPAPGAPTATSGLGSAK